MDIPDKDNRDEAQLEVLAKRLLTTAPKPREEIAGKGKPAGKRKKDASKERPR